MQVPFYLQESFWGQNIIPLLSIHDLGKLQQLDRKSYLMMQPKSERCQVDFKAMFGIDVAAEGYEGLDQVAKALLKAKETKAEEPGEAEGEAAKPDKGKEVKEE